MKSNKAWVYIVECADGTLYTGWTTNIKRRLATHNAGRGAKYTRARLPVSLRWSEAHPTRSAALKREAVIKKLKRKEKLKLILFQYPLRGTEGILDNSLD